MTEQSKSIAHAVGLARAAEEGLIPVRTTFKLMRRTVKLRWFESCSDCRNIDEEELAVCRPPLAERAEEHEPGQAGISEGCLDA